MVKEASLVAELQSLLGTAAVLSSERTVDFTVEGLVPRAVVVPTSVEQVADVMRYAGGEGLAVVPWGGGTLMHIGNVPRQYDIGLSLRRLDRVIEYEPADLTVSCQAGITLAELQSRLAKVGQFLALDPHSSEQSTIGGVLAANASGPSRHVYGSARDLTIGMRVVTADGRITRVGGRVVKNVAGYDLCKLYVGALGSLVVIVEATFKLSSLPQEERTLALSFDSPAVACAFALAVHRRGLTLRAIELLNASAATRAGLTAVGRYVLILWLAGTGLGLQRSHEVIVAAAAESAVPLVPVSWEGDDWEAVRRLAAPIEARLLCRLSVLPGRLASLLSAVETVGDPALLARPALGLAYVSWAGADEARARLDSLRRLVGEAGGTVVVEVCPPDLKRDIDVFGELPSAFALMRGVKQQYDPRGLLSPGRFVGGL